MFEYACSNLVEAVLDADSGSVMAMRKAAQAARTKVQLRHSCGPHMLPCPASGLQLAVQQQLDIIQLEECDLRIANVSYLCLYALHSLFVSLLVSLLVCPCLPMVVMCLARL